MWYRVERKKTLESFWSTYCNFCVDLLRNNSKRHGLNLNKSGFIKSEVYKADECVYFRQDDRIIAYVFLVTKKRPSSLYITLMCSIQPTYGRQIIDYLMTCGDYAHKYIILRATLQSVGFYIKCGFKVFDFNTFYDYVTGVCDEKLTQAVMEHAHDIKALRSIQTTICDRDWMMEGNDEIPLLIPRNLPVMKVNRT